jgi:L-fuconolactonase
VQSVERLSTEISIEIIDAQLHTWDLDSPKYPWDAASVGRLPEEIRKRYQGGGVSAEQLLSMMYAVGVDAALLTSPMVYGWDHRYAFDAAARHPGKFGVVGPLGPTTPNLEERVRTFRDQPGGVGVRVVVLPGTEGGLNAEGYVRIFATAERADVPIFVAGTGLLRSVPDVARAYPNLQLVIDHLGLLTFLKDVDRFAMLPDLLALAEFDNVAVKCTAAPDMSKESYPFLDLWPHLHRVLDAFGPERVMWATDITQHFHQLTYCEAVDYMRRTDQLSESEKEFVLGKTLRRVLRWP